MCGARVAPSVCPQGHAVRPSARFCPVCGLPLQRVDAGAARRSWLAGHRRALIPAALATTIVVAVVVGVVWAARPLRGGGPTPSAANSSTTAAAVPPVLVTDPASVPPAPLSQQTADPAEPPAPSNVRERVGIVDISALNADPRGPAVGQALNDYFGGINAHEYRRTLAAMDPAGGVNPNDAGQVRRFVRALRTTTDTDIVVKTVHDNPAVPLGALADVTLISRQEAKYGPEGESCTHWSLTYTFTATDDGRLLIRRATGSHRPC
jgi:hypothetical protein